MVPQTQDFIIQPHENDDLLIVEFDAPGLSAR